MSEIPLRISDSLRNEIVRLYLSGKTRDHVANVTGVSSGTVSNFWRVFKEDATESGLEFVKMSYNISKLLVSHRMLSVELTNNNLTIPKSRTGIRVMNALRNLSVNENELEQFTRDVYMNAANKGYSAEQVSEYAIKFSNFEQERAR